MGGLLQAAKSVRIIWAVIGILGLAGALFGIGNLTAFVQSSLDPLHAAVAFLPATAVDIFLFGVAAGAGIISYLLLGFIKDEK